MDFEAFNNKNSSSILLTLELKHKILSLMVMSSVCPTCELTVLFKL